MLVTIMKKIAFDSSHKLINKKLSEEENKKIYGKCYGDDVESSHGHRYFLETFIKGEIDENGFLMNFVDLKKILNKVIIEKYDHKNLNHILDCITTCENQIYIMWEDIEKEIEIFNKENNKKVFLYKLILWETPESCCILKK